MNMGAARRRKQGVWRERRAAMDNFGHGWIGAKLFLQAVITVMVLWFPHRVVLAIFTAAILFNAGIVYRNFQIAGLF